MTQPADQPLRSQKKVRRVIIQKDMQLVFICQDGRLVRECVKMGVRAKPKVKGSRCGVKMRC